MPCLPPLVGDFRIAMPPRRLAIYLGLLVAVALLGYALTFWALVACAPPPLPGLRQTFYDV